MEKPTFLELHEAVTLGEDMAAVQTLLKRGLDINCRDSFQRSMLHHLATAFPLYHTMFRNLVGLGADVNARDLRGSTPLHVVLKSKEEPLENIWLTCLPNDVPKYVKDIIEKETCATPKETFECLQIWAVEELVSLGAEVDATCDIGVTSLHRAARYGCTSAGKALISLGVSLTAQAEANYTALHLAIVDCPPKVVRCLVELGAYVNACFLQQITPLHEAVVAGKLEFVKLLVDSGAKMNYTIREISPLLSALDHGNYELTRVLLQLRADVNANLSSYGAVHQSIQSGRADILDFLCKRRANLLFAFDNMPAFAVALSLNHMDKFKFFVENGADVNKRFVCNVSPLFLAIRQGSEELVRVLAEAAFDLDNVSLVEGFTALHLSILHGNVDALKMVLAHGGDTNTRVDSNVRLIHEAVARKDKRMVSLLAKYGANTNAGKTQGMCPISFALTLGVNKLERTCTEDIRILVNSGADLNLTHDHNVTPLHDATKLRDLEMVKVLAVHHTDMDRLRCNGLTPFCIAVDLENTDTARYLAQCGADVNVQSSTLTPLHDAVQNSDLDMVNTLIECGADVTSVGSNITPLIWIVRNDHLLLEHLVKGGADINVMYRTRISILHYAVMSSDLHMFLTLMTHFRHRKLLACTDVSLIYEAAMEDAKDTVEKLLEMGIKPRCLRSVPISYPDLAKELGKPDLDNELLERLSVEYEQESTILSECCLNGYLDVARTLVFYERNVVKDCQEVVPLECLPLFNTVSYGAFVEVAEVDPLVEETNEILTTGCEDLTTILQTPGLGSTRFIMDPDLDEIKDRALKLLQHLPRICRHASNAEIMGIGSTAEGTKVGLPNEMDFMFRFPVKTGDHYISMQQANNGFVHMDYKLKDSERPVNLSINPDFQQELIGDINHSISGRSSSFHTHFFTNIAVGLSDLAASKPDDKLHIKPHVSSMRQKDRKACSVVYMDWDFEDATFRISVDLVPCVHINDWPEGAVRRTWLMSYEELRERGYVLVPKPPHPKSEIAKNYTELELQTLWKISFPHLETEHMQQLDQRIRDVYVTAKSLRNPDVCRIMIMDEGIFPQNVDKYISSYMLKMVFFRNAEYFISANLELDEMVYKLYNDLHKCLKNGFISTFFLPDVDALCGRKVNYPKMAKIAGIMKRFVKMLKERGKGRQGVASCSADDGMRKQSVYRTYKLSSWNVEGEFESAEGAT